MKNGLREPFERSIPETRSRVPGMRFRRFLNLSVHNLRNRPQRTLLTAVGIVLGVGIVFAVLTLSATMSGAFTNLFSWVYGSADLTVTAAGGNGAFDEGALGAVWATPGVASAAPRLSVPASLLLPGGTPLDPEVRSLSALARNYGDVF